MLNGKRIQISRVSVHTPVKNRCDTPTVGAPVRAHKSTQKRAKGSHRCGIEWAVRSHCCNTSHPGGWALQYAWMRHLASRQGEAHDCVHSTPEYQLARCMIPFEATTTTIIPLLLHRSTELLWP